MAPFVASSKSLFLSGDDCASCSTTGHSTIVLHSTQAVEDLSSKHPLDTTLSIGSTVSADSFVAIDPDFHDDVDEPSIDPYLDTNKPIKRRQSRRPRHDVEEPPFRPPPPRTKKASSIAESENPPVNAVSCLSLGTFDFPKNLVIPRALMHNTVKEEEEEKKDSECCYQSKTLCSGVTIHPLTRECDELVSRQVDRYGPVHLQTARAFLELGRVHMEQRSYEEAVDAFDSARRVFTRLHGDSHVAVALACDKLGLARCKLNHSPENLQAALEALSKAFEIRHLQLGPWHVDTVDTLNNMAGVYSHMNDLDEACSAYQEVYLVRRAIFGPDHPSVAITAQSLGSVYLKLAKLKEAHRYYKISLDIYHRMQLNNSHPAVQRLVRDMKRLERVRRSMK